MRRKSWWVEPKIHRCEKIVVFWFIFNFQFDIAIYIIYIYIHSILNHNILMYIDSHCILKMHFGQQIRPRGRTAWTDRNGKSSHNQMSIAPNHKAKAAQLFSKTRQVWGHTMTTLWQHTSNYELAAFRTGALQWSGKSCLEDGEGWNFWGRAVVSLSLLRTSSSGHFKDLSGHSWHSIHGHPSFSNFEIEISGIGRKQIWLASSLPHRDSSPAGLETWLLVAAFLHCLWWKCKQCILFRSTWRIQ